MCVAFVKSHIIWFICLLQRIHFSIPWEDQLSCGGRKRALWWVNKLKELFVVLRSQYIISGSEERQVSSCQKKSRGCFENQDKKTHLEMRMTSFIVCRATSLSLSRVMEIKRSWIKNCMKTHMHKTFIMFVLMCVNNCEHLYDWALTYW